MTPAEHHTETPPRPRFIYLLVAVALVSFSASPILVRFASDGPGIAVAFWRSLFAVGLLAPVALLRGRDDIRAFTRRDWMLTTGAGVMLGLHFIFWIESLYHTTVASASVLVTTSPIFIAIFGYLFLKERVTRGVMLAIVLGVPGAALIGWDESSVSAVAGNPLLGNALALLAAVIVSLYLLIGRVVRQRRSWIGYVFPLYTIVALTVLVTGGIMGTPLFGFDPLFYVWCFLMAVGPSILGHGMFNYALKYVSATFLGVLALVEPVGASLAAYVLFGEVPGWVAVGGMMLVLTGVTCAVVPARWFRRSGA